MAQKPECIIRIEKIIAKISKFIKNFDEITARAIKDNGKNRIMRGRRYAYTQIMKDSKKPVGKKGVSYLQVSREKHIRDAKKLKKNISRFIPKIDSNKEEED